MSRCFVVMGYGERTDPDTSKVYDLDKSYRSVIEHGVSQAGFQPVRADHILESGMISRQMYRDLMDSELVVCDLTTLNPNALYELGVRMAMRPRATIVIAAEGTKVPFNLNQNRFFWYKHGGKVIDYEDARDAQEKLANVCRETMRSQEPDSLIYSIFGERLVPPRWQDLKPSDTDARDASIRSLTGLESFATERSPRDIVAQAKSEKRWSDVISETKQLHDAQDKTHPIEEWFTQQWALATYKQRETNGATPLEDLLAARRILENLDPSNSTDPETLGLWAAVHRRLADHPDRNENSRTPDLSIAIAAYRKGYVMRHDHYNAVNYAFLLLRRALSLLDSDLRRSIRDFVEATDAWRHVVDTCAPALEKELPSGTLKVEERERLDDLFWQTASLAQSLLALGDASHAFARRRLDQLEALLGETWMVDTTNKQEASLSEMLASDNYKKLKAPLSLAATGAAFSTSA